MLMNYFCMNVALLQRPVDASTESVLQDLLLPISPCTIYSFAPLLAGLFLWNSSSNQFAFALLPTTVQKSNVLRLLAAAFEFQVVMLLMAAAHCGFFHWITFLRVVRRELVNNFAKME